jgi:hypothetical protein
MACMNDDVDMKHFKALKTRSHYDPKAAPYRDHVSLSDCLL